MNIMDNKNYYEVLGLAPTCTLHEIKRSYYQLALIWHPDKQQNKKEAQNSFTFINEAYNVLSDTNKRRTYDTYGLEGLKIEESSNSDDTRESIFDKKGFCGTDKSAFEILRDICREKDDDYFFKNEAIPEVPSDFQSTLKSFLHKNIISEDEGENFVSTYRPSFMNMDFSSHFASFNDLYTSATSGIMEISTQQKRKNSFCILDTSETDDNDFKKLVTPSMEGISLDKKRIARPQKMRKSSFLTNNGDQDDIDVDFMKEEIKVERKLSFWSETFDESDDCSELNDNSKKIHKLRKPNLQNMSLKSIRKRLMRQNLL